MTEPTFPFEAMDSETGADAGPDRRKLFALLGAGALVAALLGYFLILPMLSGSPTLPASLVVPAPHRSAPTFSASPRPVTKTFAGVVGRDPFNPLVRPPVVAAAAATGTTSTGTMPTGTTSTGPTATGGTSTGTGTGVTVSPAPVASSSPAPAPTQSTPVSTPGMVTFKLLSTSGSTARVSVDGKTYTWAVGKTYLGSFMLVKIGVVGEGFFLYGDMPIHISAGQTYIFGK